MGRLESPAHLQLFSADVVSKLIVGARGRICNMEGLLRACPTFQGDNDDMKVLQLCKDIEKTGKCEDQNIGKYTKASEDGTKERDQEL